MQGSVHPRPHNIPPCPPPWEVETRRWLATIFSPQGGGLPAPMQLPGTPWDRPYCGSFRARSTSPLPSNAAAVSATHCARWAGVRAVREGLPGGGRPLTHHPWGGGDARSALAGVQPAARPSMVRRTPASISCTSPSPAGPCGFGRATHGGKGKTKPKIESLFLLQMFHFILSDIAQRNASPF